METNKNSFTDTIIKMVLPCLQELIEKEQAHLKYLESIPKNKVPSVSIFIETSKNMLAHYLQRRTEYEEYFLSKT